MLQVKNITKKYSVGGFEQFALNDVSMNFRESEFVSILGPSGSGKTTLLNIIGGLDQYDSGDLIINEMSTKKYTDRDWDTYRNSSVGFVFQNYNLIGHQTVLANVEMALTLSGVGKADRLRRAKDALARVGLSAHMHKKPNQLSGGQMQRVAIARALINNPDIILADEPTGALDSETSTQVLEILKEISKTKLVVMVTHNSELAQQYSTRIIQLKDGRITSDTNPLNTKLGGKVSKPLKKKTSIGFKTALSLSLNNLLTKKGRTALTSIAGSIGIIGIALILAISTGVNNYIAQIQKDALSSYPIEIKRESTDMSVLMENLMGVASDDADSKHGKDAVYANPIMFRMMKTMLNANISTNNLKPFKEFLENNNEELYQYASAIKYDYGIDLNIYAKDKNSEYSKADFFELMESVVGNETGFMGSITSVMNNMNSVTIWQELLTDPKTGNTSKLITDQYDLIHGKWPTEKDEVLLVLTKNNEISDLTLYALGLVDKSTMISSTISAMTGKNEDTSYDEIFGKSWSYEEICKIPLKMVLPTDYYRYDDTTGLWINISDNPALLNSVIEKGLTLHVSGIVRPKEDAISSVLSGSLCYTSALTEYYINGVNESSIVKDQMSDKNQNVNVITGKPFVIEDEKELTDKEKIDAFRTYIANLSDMDKAKLYESILANPDKNFIEETLGSILSKYADKDVSEIVNDIANNYATQLGYSPELIIKMLSDYNKEELITLLDSVAREMIIKTYKQNAADKIDSIKKTPSSLELAKIKEMIKSEMFSSIAELPEAQRTHMMQQIKLGYVTQKWVASTGMSRDQIASLVSSMSGAKLDSVFDTLLNEDATAVYREYSGTSSDVENTKKVAAAFDEFISNATDEDILYYYNNNMSSQVSEQTYSEVLEELGVCSMDNPSAIYIYPIDFEMKAKISNMIDRYNKDAAKDNQIKYADMVGIIMSSVTAIVDTISVVLICFVSVSLIVSSIMIGIITYVSVLERTKEIGILRAIGASKRDISMIFNIETAIIGLIAGVIGIVTTLLLCLPINAIARSATGIESLTAVLPLGGYLLIVLSVVLTLIAGLLPARMAAKKDPTIALRSE